MDKTIAIRLSADLHRKIRNIAIAERRSVAQQIRILISELPEPFYDDRADMKCLGAVRFDYGKKPECEPDFNHDALLEK